MQGIPGYNEIRMASLLHRTMPRVPMTQGQTRLQSDFLDRRISMECTVRWMGNDAGMSFVGEGGSGHAVVMDGAPEAGGRNLGLRPMEMVLAGTGGCTAFDVVLILKKGRHAVTGCEVSLNAERAEADPRVFTRIHFHYKVKGRQLKPEAVARAIDLSKDKYCSASIMLGKTAEMTCDFEILEES